MTKLTFTAYSIVTIALMIVSADLIAAPGRGMRTARAQPAGMESSGMAGAMTPDAPGAMSSAMQPVGDAAAHPNGDPPSPDEVLQPDGHSYRPVRLEVRKIIWFDPGQRGLIEAHPLVMGLAAMALATVTLLFFFLRGIKRPKDGEL
jgi:hypothetical protein